LHHIQLGWLTGYHKLEKETCPYAEQLNNEYDETKELDEIISTGESLQIVRVPGKYWHGFKAIGNESAFLIYFANNLYNYKNPDELRRPWNDQSIVPKKINGREDDARCNKPWDWFYPPFK
jgi:dTDP-4-dehydrorhamnose 3,5-epimerase